MWPKASPARPREEGEVLPESSKITLHPLPLLVTTQRPPPAIAGPVTCPLICTQRLSKTCPGPTAARTPTTATKATAPARGRGPRATTVAKAAGKRGSSSLNDRVLALAIGKTQQEIAAACKGARPNHVGAALSRHKRAGRIEERDVPGGAIRRQHRQRIEPTGTEPPAGGAYQSTATALLKEIAASEDSPIPPAEQFVADSPQEGSGFPLRGRCNSRWPRSASPDAVMRVGTSFFWKRDSKFESTPLQRGVDCEPDFRGRILSMTVGPFFFL